MSDSGRSVSIRTLWRISLGVGAGVCAVLLALSLLFRAPGGPVDVGDAVLGGLNVATFVFLGQAAPYGASTRRARFIDALVFGLTLFTIQFAGTVAKVLLTRNARFLETLPVAAAACLVVAAVWFFVMPWVRDSARSGPAAE